MFILAESPRTQQVGEVLRCSTAETWKAHVSACDVEALGTEGLSCCIAQLLPKSFVIWKHLERRFVLLYRPAAPKVISQSQLLPLQREAQQFAFSAGLAVLSVDRRGVSAATGRCCRVFDDMGSGWQRQSRHPGSNTGSGVYWRRRGASGGFRQTTICRVTCTLQQAWLPSGWFSGSLWCVRQVSIPLDVDLEGGRSGEWD
jgi:hypothetical protein